MTIGSICEQLSRRSATRITVTLIAFIFIFAPDVVAANKVVSCPVHSVQIPGGGAVKRLFKSLKRIRPAERKIPKSKKTFDWETVRKSPIDEIIRQVQQDSVHVSTYGSATSIPYNTYNYKVYPHINPSLKVQPVTTPFLLTFPLDTLEFERKMRDLKRSIDNTRKNFRY